MGSDVPTMPSDPPDPAFGVDEEELTPVECPEKPPAHDFWKGIGIRAPEIAMQACVSSASSLISALSVLMAAHLAVLAIPGLTRPYAPAWDVAAEVAWLVALLTAISVVLPQEWKGFIRAPATIERSFTRLLQSKYKRVLGAVVFTVGGVVLLGLALLVG